MSTSTQTYLENGSIDEEDGNKISENYLRYSGMES